MVCGDVYDGVCVCVCVCVCVESSSLNDISLSLINFE